MSPTRPALANIVALNDFEDNRWPTHNQESDKSEQTVDHFTTRNGVEFAGTHLMLDLWGANQLNDLALMEATMRKAVDVAGATLLHIHLHHFTPNGGISGVAVLAESHISVHTWPERNFAAFDVFMCGDAQPELTIPVLKEAFSPTNINVSEHLRGTSIAANQSATKDHEQ
ncbi:MAG: adenosylmethionine decarboxylase [Gammaproteobacteria bacterium]|nr:adenosylmethionine decarboxylase [Gammaproteobacteria bacterium]